MKNIKLPKHLIIGDPHASPSYDNDRFIALGRLIVKEKPDTIICIGDMADMPSLSSYDKGTQGFEGRRFKADCDATIDAQRKLFEPIKDHNRHLINSKKATYKPRLVMCLGNHENRIERALNHQPELEGTIGYQSLKYDDFGWEVIPYQVPITIDGVNYAHFFASGVSGRPISGESIGKTLCMKNHASSVQGHSHILDHSERTVVDGTKIFGLACGCYTHKDMIEDWNIATHKMWYRGIVILDGLDGKGYYDSMTTITQRKILREYL